MTYLTLCSPTASSLYANSERIEERYRNCLRSYVMHEFPEQPTRFQQLLARLPEVRRGAAVVPVAKQSVSCSKSGISLVSQFR